MKHSLVPKTRPQKDNNQEVLLSSSGCHEPVLMKLLRGKLVLKQPKKGYRSGIDPLFLAASVPADEGSTVLDVGSGVGTALLALTHRKKITQGVGLEMQRELVRMASDNIKMNGFADRLDVMKGDLASPPPRLSASSFCHVMSNPPYYDADDVTRSPLDQKRYSTTESSACLKIWIEFCVRMLKPKGSLTVIFTTERLDELLRVMGEKLGGLELFPLWSKGDRPAKRIIVRGWKNNRGPTKLFAGLVLHQTDGAYTHEAKAILDKGLALDGWL